MNYNLENDNELLFLIEENDENAENILIQKYTSIINIIIRKYASLYPQLGLEEKDLYQEGLIGLMRAIKSFDKDKNVLFYTYASLCIDSAIKTCLRSADKQKNKILNSSFSLDTLLDNNKDDFYNIIIDDKTDPEYKIIEQEEEKSEIETLKGKLTEFETQVFELKMVGFTNDEIAQIVSKDKKSVENTLSRIKAKYKNNN